MAKRPPDNSADFADGQPPASKRLRTEEPIPSEASPERPVNSTTNDSLGHEGVNDAASQNGGASLPVKSDAINVDEDEEEYDPEQYKQTRLIIPWLEVLHSINLDELDFDVERTCCETLATQNIYLCLVCGKYFQGKGQSTPAYVHSLKEGHNVFLSMHARTRKVWVLPDSYEMNPTTKVPFPKPKEPEEGWRNNLAERTAKEEAIRNSRWAFADLQWQIEPKQSKRELLSLDTAEVEPLDIFDVPYRPGFLGLTNLREGAYINVVLHALNHVLPIRDYFLLEDLEFRPALVRQFVMLLRRAWNPRALQSQVAPHEFFNEVAQRSKHAYSHEKAGDPVQFLAFILNKLHSDIGGKKSAGSSIIHKTLQGVLQMESQPITTRADLNDLLRFEDGPIKSSDVHFLFLPLDLPPMPVFKAGRGVARTIPQVSLDELLSQYDGQNAKSKGQHRQRFRIKYPPPPYLIFAIKRFTNNDFGTERNSTIVTFNPNGLDMKPYIVPGPWRAEGEPVEYDLVANVTHETISTHADTVNADVEKDVWRVQLRDRPFNTWRAIDNITVTQTHEELLYVDESYIQVWEHRKIAGNRAAAMQRFLDSQMEK